MKVLSENTTELREGFVVEETLSGCKAGCIRGTECGRFVAIPGDHFEFQDITQDIGVRQSTGWSDEITGRCPTCGNEVTFRQMFVVTKIVRTETRTTEDVLQ